MYAKQVNNAAGLRGGEADIDVPGNINLVFQLQVGGVCRH